MTLVSQDVSRDASALVTQSAFDGSRVRVVLLIEVHEGAQQRFLEAYEQLRHRVASVPGHLSDQLCQSIENPSQWLLTSEWESAPPFLAWVNSEAHLDMVQPLNSCVRDTRSLRFSILRETSGTVPSGTRDAVAAPRFGDGLVRHALTFTVEPGSEGEVARILAGYRSPEARADAHTRLVRTTLFMHGHRVVRAVEVQGDLVTALRHVARQPEIREVERAVNPYLEQDRDLDDPTSARRFFTRAALPAVHRIADPAADPGAAPRHAFLYPVRSGCGTAVARLLAREDVRAAREGPDAVAASTVFQQDDVVVRLVETDAPPAEHSARVLGVSGRRAGAVLARLVETDGARELTTAVGLESFLARCRMDLVTDRRAGPADPAEVTDTANAA
ncbi:SchA/CurD-like domain-containing protein [Streptomyces sp. NA04227]|uniref:SchA/CurD-like domain-containing protein n=1 Tax=Streptomyces sp. NA04227 TaxID=2742136 RepID=UPI0020CA5538|nr:SchA/CurD-like domain-containing protein [Streptomyces sp. NA04227]